MDTRNKKKILQCLRTFASAMADCLCRSIYDSIESLGISEVERIYLKWGILANYDISAIFRRSYDCFCSLDCDGSVRALGQSLVEENSK